MADSPKKRGKPDRKRVSLGQEHEREYLDSELTMAAASLAHALGVVRNVLARLRAGYPKATRKRREP